MDRQMDGQVLSLALAPETDIWEKNNMLCFI